MLVEEITWQDRLAAAEGERDKARAFAKAWKAIAWRRYSDSERWRSEALRVTGAFNALSIQWAYCRIWARLWKRAAKRRRETVQHQTAEITCVTGERNYLRSQLANHVEADTRAAEASLHVDQRQVRLERVVSAAREYTTKQETVRFPIQTGFVVPPDFEERKRAVAEARSVLLASLANLDAWEESRRQEAGG